MEETVISALQDKEDGNALFSKMKDTAAALARWQNGVAKLVEYNEENLGDEQVREGVSPTFVQPTWNKPLSGRPVHGLMSREL